MAARRFFRGSRPPSLDVAIGPDMGLVLSISAVTGACKLIPSGWVPIQLSGANSGGCRQDTTGARSYLLVASTPARTQHGWI
jgi:hypothetical protein